MVELFIDTDSKDIIKLQIPFTNIEDEIDIYFKEDPAFASNNLIIDLDSNNSAANLKIYNNLNYDKLYIFSKLDSNFGNLDLTEFKDVIFITGDSYSLNSFHELCLKEVNQNYLHLNNLKANNLKVIGQNIELKNCYIKEKLELNITNGGVEGKLSITNTNYNTLDIILHNSLETSYIDKAPDKVYVRNYTDKEVCINFEHENIKLQHYGSYVDIHADFTNVENLQLIKSNLISYIKKYNIHNLDIISNESIDFDVPIILNKLSYKGIGNLTFNQQLKVRELEYGNNSTDFEHNKIIFNNKVDIKNLITLKNTNIYHNGELVTSLNPKGIKTLKLTDYGSIISLTNDEGIGVKVSIDDLEWLFSNCKSFFFHYYFLDLGNKIIKIDAKTPVSALNNYGLTLLCKKLEEGQEYVELTYNRTVKLSNEDVINIKSLKILNSAECILKDDFTISELYYEGSLNQAKLIIEGKANRHC